MQCLTALFAVVLAAPSDGRQPADDVFDVVIIHGRVVDGTGNPWFTGDVAIRDDRIVHVGRLTDAQVKSARRVIDASELVVAPGFVDMHSHSDRTLLIDGSAVRSVVGISANQS